MPNELKPCPFNDLPFEERKRINYYINQFRIRTLEQVILMLNNSIGSYQKQKIRDWIKDIKRVMESEDWGSDNG